jgi:deazaflavin-dependent oxidoreductase (nitroreductase family)
MAKPYRVTFTTRIGNILATVLMRAGLTVGPISLLTVRGRKSGQPRTTPVAVVEVNGKRYLVATFGLVNWVRNLRAAGEATLTRNRRSETISVLELSPEEAARILQAVLGSGPSFTQSYFDVTPESPFEDFVREATNHPVFLVQRIADIRLEIGAGDRTIQER